MAEIRPIDLYEFLAESELQQYYSSIKDELKITNASHLKYATDEDLRQIGCSKPEIRRLRKYYEKYYPHGYLSKIKRLLQPPIRRDDNQIISQNSTEPIKVQTLPSKTPTQKHIIPADLISVNKQLGAGEFGVVQQGVWTNGTERIQVAIKCLCRERMQSNPIEFLKEAAIMHAIEHENIVRLYGVVLDTNSLMLVTELAHLRSLLECLKDPGLRVNFLTVPTLCEFAMQICNGMMYLENKRLIHRDLAARNILVFSKNKVKISDFGLSRALGVGKDYYKTNFNVNLKLPIAWCAPECITFLRFTNASDVWAYGVCLWEMFSYGFQPWAALTGLQILEAIDDPNYQRLEQPECCPREYYNLMLRCWQHEPAKRPKFNEIYSLLPDMKPEQLKTVVNNCEPKKDHLLYLQGEIITVLDKNTNSPFWKGVLNSGKTGLFNPSNTVAYLEGLPSSTNRDGFFRTNERLSKKKLRSEMISMPQNDLKHTLHIGLDGAYFGDVSLLGSTQQSNHLPKQIVTPYKPSEDIEQTPLLLPPTPTSPDSIQTASTYFPEENQTISQTNPSFINSNQNTPQNHSFHHAFDFPPKTPAFSSSNPFASEAFGSPNSTSNKKDETKENNVFTNSNLEDESLTQDFKSNNNQNWPSSTTEGNGIEVQHEYHEISDDEMIVDKFDYGPSLLDEINSMFGCINMANDEISMSKLQGPLNNSKTADIVDLHLKGSRKTNGNDNNGNKTKKKNCGTVKPISVKDEKILNQAIEIANEISAKSMTDLVSDTASQTMRSPKRKFSFRLPHLTHNTTAKDHTLPNYSSNGSNGTCNSQLKERKKFSEELKSISDLQNTITEEGREAYNSLIEKKSKMAFDSELFNLATTKTLPKNIFKLDDVPKNDLKKNRKALITPISLNQNDNRPMTLPNRNSSKFNKIDDIIKTDLINKENSILIRAQQKQIKNEKYLNESNSQIDCVNNENSNPIPLPPRDRTKVILTNAKRHVRKHPLIIPANGVQRTINKVTQQSPENEYPKHSFADLKLKYNRLTLINNYNCQKDNKESENVNKVNLKLTELIKERNTTTTPAPIKPPRNGHSNNNNNNDNNNKNLYANLDILHMSLKSNYTDSASLSFENAIEHSFDQDDVLSSPDVTDGFCPFSIQKEESKKINFNNSKISGLYVNEDELRNLDFDQTDISTGENLVNKKIKSPKLNSSNCSKKAINNGTEIQPRDDIVKNYEVGNVKDSKDEVDNFIEENENLFLSKEINFNNSVSCEDLLEFSNRKPKGCERGVDSDEVRIMLKVLGKDVSPLKCLTALEIIDWDVHKAIKMIKFQNISNMEGLSEVQNILKKHEWDLQTAVFESNIMNEN